MFLTFYYAINQIVLSFHYAIFIELNLIWLQFLHIS